MDSEHTALTADEHGNYPADGTVIAAVETSYISGVLERDAGTTKLTAVDGWYSTTVVSQQVAGESYYAGTAALKNKYTEVLGKVEIKKIWADRDFNISTMPDSVTVSLTRTSKTEGNAIILDDIVLNTANNWIWTSDDLEIYAPNGEEYQYSAIETTVNGFKTPVITTSMASASTIGEITITNTPLYQTITINKTWNYEDASGEAVTPSQNLLFCSSLQGVASKITYHYAYSLDNGSTWNLLKKANGTDAFESVYELQTDGTYKAASDVHLPSQVFVSGTLTTVTYKAFEYSMTFGNQTYSRTSDTDFASGYTFGKITSTSSLTGSTLTVTNTLPVEPITITKTWSGPDIPTELDVTVTRNKVNLAGDSATATVKLTAADNWTQTVYVPICSNYASSEKSTYSISEANDPSFVGSVAKTASNTIPSENDYTGGYSIDLGDTSGTHYAWLKNKAFAASVTLTKYDADDQLNHAVISDTVFTLSDGTNSSVLSTGTDGKVTFSGLKKGSYTLTETTANSNYVIPENPLQVQFDITDSCQGETLEIDSDHIGDKTNFNLQVTAGDSSLTKLGVGNNRKTGSVEIKKTGADAKGLDGVTFKLYRSTDSQTAVETGITASGGSLSFTNLTWGDYYLVETGVPAGYQIDSTHHTFTISKDSLTKQFTNDSAINNTKTSFTLQKQNSDGIALNGATFKLEGLFAGEQQSSTITLLGSNENNVTLTGKLIVNEHYTLTETAAPDGYARLNTAIGFTMNADGTITLDEGTPACVSLTDGGKGIAVKDNPIQITIQKKDRDTQQSLSDCHFKLSGVFANTSETVFNGTDAQITAAIIGKLYSTSDSVTQYHTS